MQGWTDGIAAALKLVYTVGGTTVSGILFDVLMIWMWADEFDGSLNLEAILNLRGKATLNSSLSRRVRRVLMGVELRRLISRLR